MLGGDLLQTWTDHAQQGEKRCAKHDQCSPEFSAVQAKLKQRRDPGAQQHE
jgi:hypothetical protein